jgi:hypothetical protein
LVALNPPGGGFAGTLQVVVNDGEAVEAVSRRRGDTVQAPLSLAAGWNTLTIEMTGAGQAAPDAADTVDSCATADPADSILRLKTINLRLGASPRDTG